MCIFSKFNLKSLFQKKKRKTERLILSNKVELLLSFSLFVPSQSTDINSCTDFYIPQRQSRVPCVHSLIEKILFEYLFDLKAKGEE